MATPEQLKQIALARDRRRRIGMCRPRYKTVMGALRKATAAVILRQVDLDTPSMRRLLKRLERDCTKVIRHYERYEAAVKAADERARKESINI